MTVNKGHWPSGASIAVFLFNNDEGANKWFEEYSKVCKQSGFDILDAVIGATKGSIQSGKETLMVVCRRYILPISKNKTPKTSTVIVILKWQKNWFKNQLFVQERGIGGRTTMKKLR